MPVAFTRGPYKVPSLEQLEGELSGYVKHLIQIHIILYLQVCEATHGTRVKEPLWQVGPRDYRLVVSALFVSS